MTFSFYNRLTRRQQTVYRASDRVPRLELAEPSTLRALAADLDKALASEDRARTRRAADGLLNRVCAQLGVAAVTTRVLVRRPSSAAEELHGLYERPEQGAARITVWMRTASQRRVVAFRTFLRTLLHELCHHLDYTLLRLEDSFHTEGFFRRESSLFEQIVPAVEGPPRPPREKKLEPRPGRRRTVQLPLFPEEPKS